MRSIPLALVSRFESELCERAGLRSATRSASRRLARQSAVREQFLQPPRTVTRTRNPFSTYLTEAESEPSRHCIASSCQMPCCRSFVQWPSQKAKFSPTPSTPRTREFDEEVHLSPVTAAHDTADYELLDAIWAIVSLRRTLLRSNRPGSIAANWPLPLEVHERSGPS